MKKAGLNPLYASDLGGGASTPSGNAGAGGQASGAIAGLLSKTSARITKTVSNKLEKIANEKENTRQQMMSTSARNELMGKSNQELNKLEKILKIAKML